MIPINLYQYVVIETPLGAYAYKLLKWAGGEKIVDYSTTRTMAHNLTIDYIQVRDNGTPFPLNHSMTYYQGLMDSNIPRCNFQDKCHQEIGQQAHERRIAKRELQDDLWRLRNRKEYMKSCLINTRESS